MSQYTIEVNIGNFEQVVIEGSKKVPVLVDFWAPWCAPCRALTPILEKLAAEYEGRFVLAKVNSDENQELAGALGVRGIPNVKAFAGGRLVDEFTGALPESAVRAFIGRFVPSPAEELRREAADIYGRSKDGVRALELLARAAALDPDNVEVAADRAGFLIDLGRTEEAKKLLAALPPLVRMEEKVAALEARADFAASAGAAPGADELRERIERDGNDLEARLLLAQLQVAEKNYAPALEQLLEIVKRDRSFRDDAARKTMLQVFSILGNDGDLVSTYRRRLASAMY
jgi:putative thioredoxin